jgi:hypothetical protein
VRRGRAQSTENGPHTVHGQGTSFTHPQRAGTRRPSRAVGMVAEISSQQLHSRERLNPTIMMRFMVQNL